MFLNRFTGTPFRSRFDVPEVFGEALSYEDQILWLAKHFKKLKDYVDSFDFDKMKDEIIDEVETTVTGLLNPFMAEVRSRLTEIERKVDDGAAENMIWDPTQGDYVPSKEAMRRVYAALVQTGTSHVHDMSNLTVDEMNGKTVHAYSVTGLAEVDWSDEI